ncbi:MAG: hypothetical protein Q7S55_04535 [Nanoarchaeota archaeon]|nr:hypothetical protein [Nanoarchaeota archaeon]
MREDPYNSQLALVELEKDKVFILLLGYKPWIKFLLHKWVENNISCNEVFGETVRKNIQSLKEYIQTQKKFPKGKRKLAQKWREIALLSEQQISTALLKAENKDNIGGTTVDKSLKLFANAKLKENFIQKVPKTGKTSYWSIALDYSTFKRVTLYFLQKDKVSIYCYYLNTLYFQEGWEKYQDEIVKDLLKHEAMAQAHSLTNDQKRILKILLTYSPSLVKFAFSPPVFSHGEYVHPVSTFYHMIHAFLPATSQRDVYHKIGDKYVQMPLKNNHKEALDSLFYTYLNTNPPKEYSPHIMIALFYLIIDLHNHRFIEAFMPMYIGKIKHTEDIIAFIERSNTQWEHKVDWGNLTDAQVKAIRDNEEAKIKERRQEYTEETA